MALIDTAVRLIEKNGRPVSIRRTSTTTGDPAKPWGGAGDTTTATDELTTAVFFNENAQDLEARLSTAGQLVVSPVEQSKVLVYLAARDIGVAPTIADKLVDGSRVLEIQQVETVQPGSQVILYILKVEN
jgi:hypothetical protein